MHVYPICIDACLDHESENDDKCEFNCDFNSMDFDNGKFHALLS
jgi:hypothetical protein